MNNLDKLIKLVRALEFRGGAHVTHDDSQAIVTISDDSPGRTMFTGESSEEAAKKAIDELAEDALMSASGMRQRSDAIYEALGMATSETIARELLERAKAENDAIRAELGCGEGDPLEVIRRLKNKWTPLPIAWPTYAEISAAWFGQDGNISVDASHRVLDLFWDRVMRRPRDAKTEQPLSDTYKFDAELVDQLAKECELYARDYDRNYDFKAGVQAVLAELAKAPVEIPTDDDALRLFFNPDPGESYEKSVLRICAMFRARIAPTIAARDAEIVRLSAECASNASEIDRLTRRVSAVLSAKETNDVDWRARAEELQAKIDAANARSLGASTALVAELQARVAELEKQRAPIDTQGKTPGQIDYEAYGMARFGGAGCTPWDRLDDKTRNFNERAAQAVLRAFGGAERIKELETRLEPGELNPCHAHFDGIDYSELRRQYAERSVRELLDAIIQLTHEVRTIAEQRDQMLALPDAKKALRRVRKRIESGMVHWHPSVNENRAVVGLSDALGVIDSELTKLESR